MHNDIGSVTGAHVKLSSEYKRAATRVINITAWQQYLATTMKSPSTWGPASFAIEMVRAPQQMIFLNSGSTAQEVPND